MTLSSITITGFKSFAKKTTIDISRNVTGIVGPNGSGKSNVAEAIRFVLGEQSMKSIRSKSMGDLIFKGSSTLGSLSRASVSITIDNKNKSASRGVSEEIAPFLAYDEIVLSREVYIDGGSTYKINNTDVRLKDVQAILALAGIGTSVHTIISQGEADRILLVSAEERKEMIQDALGLRVHEMRLKESERKLAKVEEHMKTVSLMRRELAPELNHLRIQIEKISKVEEEREKLLNNYILYFVYESKLISELKSKTKNYASNTERLTQIEEEKRGLAKREEDLELRRRSGAANKKVKEEERYTLERALAEVTYQKNLLKNELEKIPTHASISKTDYEKFKNEIKRLTDELEIAISNNDQNKTRSLIGGINHTIEHQFPEFSQVGRTDDIQRQIAECVSKENDIKNKI
jgi:chromosome segregation protein